MTRTLLWQQMTGGTARRLTAVTVSLVAFLAASPAVARAADGPFPDVPADHWAVRAITFVTNDTREWIPARAEGFEPNAPFTRRDLARAMYRAFPPPKGWNVERLFDDVAADDPMIDAFRWADQRDFLPVRDGRIDPDGTVSRYLLDPALVRALGYGAEAAAVSRAETADGKRLTTRWSTGFLFAANRLDIHQNRSTESLDLLPGQVIDRAHAASIFRRVADIRRADPWDFDWRFDGYLDIVLPEMSPARLAAARFAFEYAGYPYVWAGENWKKTGVGYPYGSQAQGGFDCTGFAWWVLHDPSSSGYPAPELRGYPGWELPWRTATEMARNTNVRRTWDEIKPLDLAFWDFDGDRSRIDHAGLMLGNGWLIHSSGSKGGVTLEKATNSYMREVFVFARRVIPPRE